MRAIYKRNLQRLDKLERGKSKQEDGEDQQSFVPRVPDTESFNAKIEFSSRPFFRDEAAQLIEKACPNLSQSDLTEPIAMDKIRLHLEAEDACRRNSLSIQVARLELDKSRFRSGDHQRDLKQAETFNDEVDQDYKVSVQLGNLKPVEKDLKLAARKAG